MANLLARYYDLNEGLLFIDGKNIRNYKLHDLRKQMGVVTQDAILFNDSIFNNIALGIENPDQKKLLKQQKLLMRTNLFQNLKMATSTTLETEDINCLVVKSNASALHEQ